MSPITGGDVNVQRRLAFSAAKLSEAHSRGDKVGAAITGSTYSSMIAALKSYHANNDPRQELQLVDVLLGLSQVWMRKYGTSKSRADIKKRVIVEDLEAEAGAERGRLQAQARYLQDANTGGMSQLTEAGTNIAVPAAKKVAAGQAERGFGTGQAAVDIVKQFGLSEAELAAIKIFTASDYVYINPATANDDKWMKGQTGGKKLVRPTPKGLKMQKEFETKLRERKEQGAMHAGMMMKAVAKLPPVTTNAYRGARMTMTEFNDRYSASAPTVYKSFASSALTESPARTFANGGGEVTPRADQTVSVMCIFSVTNGRDISELSVMGSLEKEVLLLPGATFQVTSIEAQTQGDEGKPAATDWMVVHLSQTK